VEDATLLEVVEDFQTVKSKHKEINTISSEDEIR